jgi:hypothetical protein
MRRWLAGALCTFAFQATSVAHVLDTYLQGAQLALRPNGVDVELRLIPGAQVAERLLARMDTDGDGRLSPAEERSYAGQILRDLTLKVDERPTTLSLTSLRFPSSREMREGIGTIRLALTAPAPLTGAGTHTLYFRNDHQAEIGAYLVNALVPATNDIVVTGQERDPRQRELRLTLRATPAPVHEPPRPRDALLPSLLLALLVLRWVPRPKRPRLKPATQD